MTDAGVYKVEALPDRGFGRLLTKVGANGAAVVLPPKPLTQYSPNRKIARPWVPKNFARPDPDLATASTSGSLPNLRDGEIDLPSDPPIAASSKT